MFVRQAGSKTLLYETSAEQHIGEHLLYLNIYLYNYGHPPY